jgi:hypothetical protein
MNIKSATKSSLEKRLEKLKSQIDSCLPILKGCVTISGVTNKQPKFSSKKNGKTYFTYLGKNKEPVARKYLENYHRLNGIINELSDINLELLRRMDVPRVKRSTKNF